MLIRKIIYYFLLATTLPMYGQFDHPMYEFNNNVYDDLPINQILTREDLFLKRKELKVKQIIHKTYIYYSDSTEYFEDVLDSMRLNNYIINHESSFQYYTYDKNGLLNSYHMKPFVKVFTKSDSLFLNKKRIKVDTSNGITTISVIWKNKLEEQDSYKNDKILSKQFEERQRYWYKGDTLKETIYNYKYKYLYNDAGKLTSTYLNDTLSTTYKYFKNCIGIKHSEYDKGFHEYYVAYNKIKINKFNKTVKSLFCDSTDTKHKYTIYKNSYDKKHNITRTTFFQKYFNAKPEKIYEFQNIYKNGKLFNVIYNEQRNDGRKKYTYEFNELGLITKIYSEGVTETFYYTFY